MRAAFLLASTVLVSAVLLAGCGGGAGSATTAGSTTAAGGERQSGAYEGGFEICSGGTVGEIANLYGVSEPKAEAVADVIAEAVSGGTPADAANARQGCLDAFAQRP